MPKKIYIVDLTEEERTSLLALIGKSDREIAEVLHTSPPTVQRTRQRFVEAGLENALHERPRPGASKKLDEKGEALLEMLARSEPPAGRKRWTLELLADRLVVLRAVDSISYETVRRELKKNVSSPG